MNLKDWILFNKYNIKNDNVNKSHLLFSGQYGGILYIPYEQNEEFLKLYTEELKMNNELYFIELKTKNFKYFIDIDISDNYFWDNNLIIELSSVINNIIINYYPINNLCIVTCANVPKIKNNLIHTGIHIHWPNIIVNKTIALSLRDVIIANLNNLNFNNINNWENIIDNTIYKTNGLRMIGSDKYDKIEKKSEKRIYWPITVLTPNIDDNYLNKLKNDYYVLVKNTSIKTNFDITNIKEIETISEDTTNNNIVNKNIEDWEIEYIKNFFDNNISLIIKQYNSKIITSICKTPFNNFLIKTKSKFCQNINKEHKSCGIYFMAYPEGIVQKCLCPCNNLCNRINGLCSEYVSNYFKYDNTQLFNKYNIIDDYLNIQNNTNNFQTFKPVKKKFIKKNNKHQKNVKEKDSYNIQELLDYTDPISSKFKNTL